MDTIEPGDLVEVNRFRRGAPKPYQMVVDSITVSSNYEVWGFGELRYTGLKTSYKLRCPHCGDFQTVDTTEAIIKKGESDAERS